MKLGRLEDVMDEKTLSKLLERIEDIEEITILVDTINGFMVKGKLADAYIDHITDGIVNMLEEEKNDKNKLNVFIQDFHTVNSVELLKFLEHCMGDWESEIIDRLKPYLYNSLVLKKNSRSFMFAPGFIDLLFRLVNLKKVKLVGCCTDLCVLDGTLPLINFFDQFDRNVEVEVLTDLVETYDAPWHGRDEYNVMTFKLMEQEGVKLVKKLGGNR